MKACSKYHKWTSLYILNELNDNQGKEFERHLEHCPKCSTHLGAEKSLIDKISQTQRLEGTDDLLKQCRSELYLRLQAETRSRPWPLSQRLITFFPSFSTPRLAIVGAVAVLMVGITIGRFALAPGQLSPSREIASNATKEKMIDVHGLQYNPTTKQFEVEFTTVSEVAVCGGIDNDLVREALIWSLQNPQRPGMRIRAVSALGTTQVRGDDIRTALIYTVKNDDNAGVRLKAAKVLKTLPVDEQIREAFIRVLLKDDNPAVRMVAVEALSQIHEASVVSVMQKAGRRDANEFIRLAASRSLERKK